jgi:hypothetical protein
MAQIRVRIDGIMSVTLDIPTEIDLDSIYGILLRLKKLRGISSDLPNSLKEQKEKKKGVGRGNKSNYPFLADRKLAVEFMAKFHNTAYKPIAIREELCKPYGKRDAIEKHLFYVKRILNISKDEIKQAQDEIKQAQAKL